MLLFWLHSFQRIEKNQTVGSMQSECKLKTQAKPNDIFPMVEAADNPVYLHLSVFAWSLETIVSE